MNLKSVHRFVRKELKYKVSFYSIQEYLQRQGYMIVFYNTKNGDTLVKMYNLTDIAASVNAFTFKTKELKIVFVDMNLPTADKLYSLLHETAHIYLKHIDETPAVSDTRMQEMEADAFAHEALRYEKSHLLFKGSLKLSIPIILASCMCLTFMYYAKLNAQSAASVSTMAEKVTELTSETVYITRTGEKYHRSSCYYIKDRENITAVSKQEAEKSHTPCKICNP